MHAMYTKAPGALRPTGRKCTRHALDASSGGSFHAVYAPRRGIAYTACNRQAPDEQFHTRGTAPGERFHYDTLAHPSPMQCAAYVGRCRCRCWLYRPCKSRRPLVVRLERCRHLDVQGRTQGLRRAAGWPLASAPAILRQKNLPRCSGTAPPESFHFLPLVLFRELFRHEQAPSR